MTELGQGPLATLTDGEGVALIIRTIKQKYGFTVTSEYARDFIKFVREVSVYVPRE